MSGREPLDPRRYDYPDEIDDEKTATYARELEDAGNGFLIIHASETKKDVESKMLAVMGAGWLRDILQSIYVQRSLGILIFELVEMLARFPKLNNLVLRGQRMLTDLPDELANVCPKLRVLSLRHTRIAKIPTCIARMGRLKFLDVGRTQVSSIPRALLRRRAFVLRVDGLRLTDPLPADLWITHGEKDTTAFRRVRGLESCTFAQTAYAPFPVRRFPDLKEHAGRAVLRAVYALYGRTCSDDDMSESSDEDDVSTSSDDDDVSTSGDDDGLEFTSVDSDELELTSVDSDEPELPSVYSDEPELPSVYSDEPELPSVESDEPELTLVDSDEPELTSVDSDDSLSSSGDDSLSSSGDDSLSSSDDDSLSSSDDDSLSSDGWGDPQDDSSDEWNYPHGSYDQKMNYSHFVFRLRKHKEFRIDCDAEWIEERFLALRQARAAWGRLRYICLSRNVGFWIFQLLKMLPLFPELRYLRLEQQRLLTELPDQLPDWCPRLREISLRETRLTCIPRCIGRMRNLDILDISGISSVPRELVSSRRFTLTLSDCTFTQPLPADLLSALFIVPPPWRSCSRLVGCTFTQAAHEPTTERRFPTLREHAGRAVALLLDPRFVGFKKK